MTEMLSSGGGNFTPSQLLAANVSGDNKVAINDPALILSRNSPLGTGDFANVDDWIFIPQDTLSSFTNVTVNNVPSVSPYIASGAVASCNPSLAKTMVGILMGDANLSWKTSSHGIFARTSNGNDELVEPVLTENSSTDSITFSNCYFELLDASINKYRVIFDVASINTITSVDFDCSFSSNIQILDIKATDALDGLNATTMADHDGSHLVLSSFILDGTTSGGLYQMDFIALNGILDTSDFNFNLGLINGNIVETSKCLGFTIPTHEPILPKMIISPNPMSDYIKIDYKRITNQINLIEIYDILGKKVKTIPVRSDGVNIVNIASLASGTYFLRINGVETETLVKL
jgi:hypothetical protein